MNQIVRKIIGESQQIDEKDTPKLIEKGQRTVEYEVCPHCKQEIFEKHTFTENFGELSEIERHRDCGGAIKRPPTDWSKINPEWRSLLGH